MPRNSNRKLPQNQQSNNEAQHISSLATRTPETNRKPFMRKNVTAYLTPTDDKNTDYSSNRHQSMQLDSDEDEENLSIIDENLDFNLNTILPSSLLNDPNNKHLEKLVEYSCVYKDFARQGLLGLTNNNFSRNMKGNNNNLEEFNSQFRICTLNINYQLCKSYPALFLVPKDTNDECIKKNAKCHRQNRYSYILSITYL